MEAQADITYKYDYIEDISTKSVRMGTYVVREHKSPHPWNESGVTALKRDLSKFAAEEMVRQLTEAETERRKHLAEK